MEFVTHVDSNLTATAGALDLLTKNTLTTAGVIVAAGTGVAGAAVLAAALPAQIATAAVVSGGLLYAGDRQAKGLSINPFQKDATDTTVAVKAASVEAAA